ncbi:sensor histidine kinase [Geopsychrobacter electrodiphilus]|uniref:sensor histidine kinase n=1 Tax=Geopsychrobacter electrodiphilus TaxID=225196 RepID=UPI00037D3438|nr:HAMP domain-containing sensor histidine kinase [Geopsychrobacter electrodiphilus]
MKLIRRIFHPLITFIGIQLLWILLLIGWIYWFLGRHQQLKELAEKYQTELLPLKTDWLILTEGIILLVAILVGVYVIFLYWQRQAALYRAQHNFIAQVSHELKSPLASLQLHLETIEMRQPEPQQLQKFVRLMQGDTERLHGLINNLLTASKLEHRSSNFNLEEGDFSAAVENWLQQRKNSFPKNGTLDWSIEPQLYLRFDEEALETVLRNLVENAILYAEGPPRIRIELKTDGDFALLSITDQGRGIDPRLYRKIFRMFYRVRITGKTIRGSGLGLFIVRSIIRRHHGKVWVKSAGPGKGSTFYLRLPLASKKAKDPR